jgi:GntR family transcriptional regulator, carbon starvation induced regulator
MRLTAVPSNIPNDDIPASPGGTLPRLRKDILSGQIPPGQRLSLPDLMRSYKVSASPLREALARLVSEGIVVQGEDQRGYQVARVSRENFSEVTALRKTLEVMALRQAIKLGDDEWEAEIVANLHRLSKLTARNQKDVCRVDESWEYWHRKLHSALIGASRAPVLLQLCDSLHDLSDRYRRIYIQYRRTPRDIHSEHRAIAEAAIARDTALACSLMEKHIDLTGASILSLLPEER